jgi:MoaA/NifB/PqqE/SkfB family radical SAM enzyme/esterase/lipase
MSVGIVLVHGFSGTPGDLEPLAQQLMTIYRDGAVAVPCLSGHESDSSLLFDETAFITPITDAIYRYKRDGRTLVVLGHSTGGILALMALAECSIEPDLLVLASVPKRIDMAYLERWRQHRMGKTEIPFASVAKMVSLINNVGAQNIAGKFPLMILHGKDDDLVPHEEAFGWSRTARKGPVRTVIVHNARHDLFRGINSLLAIELVARSIDDHVHGESEEDGGVLRALADLEPESSRFLNLSPASGRHIARCPSGSKATNRPILFQRVRDTEPVFANVEITTRCNLQCVYCARGSEKQQGTDMDKNTFTSILGMLPHAYRMTLVGLGEPLLHPGVVDFVAAASSHGRRTALVTNAMLLEPRLSQELIKAGLESIAFSIDAPNQGMASEVRPGTDVERIIKNIRSFVDLAKRSRPISTAIFTAVSKKTAPYLGELLELIVSLNVHVWMLTDLNFLENVETSLWKNADAHVANAVRSAVLTAFKKNLPVLSVRGLEEFGLWRRYDKFLLLPPDQLYQRSVKHTWCCSPWQTLPIGVRGTVTLCDCQPKTSVGNILNQPLTEIWNGQTMMEYRERMLGPDPPPACRVCPRF